MTIFIGSRRCIDRWQAGRPLLIPRTARFQNHLVDSKSQTRSQLPSGANDRRRLLVARETFHASVDDGSLEIYGR